MSSKISKKEMINALTKVAPGLATKEIIEQSNCFLFSNGKVGAYNDEIAVSFPFALGVDCAIQSKELLDLLNKVEDDQLKVKIKNSGLILSGDKFKSGITIVKEMAIPTDFMEISAKFKTLPKNFSLGLGICLFSTAKQAIFSNVHVSGNIVESCDNYRATRYTLPKAIKDDLLIPATSVKHLKGVELQSYCKDGGWIHFKDKEGMIYSCRTMEDKFVDLGSFFDSKGEKISLPSELATALNRSEVFSDDDSGNHLISISIKGKKAVLTSQNEVGWFRERIKIKNKGKLDIAFQINPRMLKEILSKTTTNATLSESMMLFNAKGFEHGVILYVDQEDEE